MKTYTYIVLSLGLMVASILYIPNTYPQSTDSNELSVCTEESTKHWDKIIFKIIDEEMAKQLQQPFDSELDIKILDSPKEVVDLKKKILDFLGLPNSPENRNGITINDVGYAILCNEKKIVLPPGGDEDGDGLLNKWEQNGIDFNNDNIIDLLLLDANPLHKDIYVEADYMTFHKPWMQAINNVIESFDNAPLSNPDGITGVNLHVDVDEEIEHKGTTNTINLINIRNSNFGTNDQRTDPNSANVISAKLLVYHYALFGHSQPGTSSSGISNGIPAMEFLVSLGAPGWGKDPMTSHNVGSTDQQEGTFMHELGHNLALRHGGIDNTNCKPNYLSIMSYTRQFSSLIGDRNLDYSRSTLPSLNEANLNEINGIGVSNPIQLRTIYGPSPVVLTIAGNPEDWNRDGDTLDNPISSDINVLNSCSTSPNQVLHSYDDWNNLVYIATPAPGLSLETTTGTNSSSSKLTSNTGNNTSETTTNTVVANQSEVLEELTVEDIRQHRIELLESINDAINSLPNAAFKQPQTAKEMKGNLTIKPQNETNDIASLLQSDKLNEAIGQLNELKSKTDSSFGGLAGDDLIINPQAQQRILPLIENLIIVLEKQK
jgi:hypothetical protein